MDVNLTLNGYAVRLRTPCVMGIVNITPDSFSDGGAYLSPDKAVAQCEKLIAEGAGIIDVGAESTRPGSIAISVVEELDRLRAVLAQFPYHQCILSVDTYKIEVQREAIARGAHIVNDITGGSAELFDLAARSQVGLVLMHTSAMPERMQLKTDYTDVVEDVYCYLEARVRLAVSAGVPAVWCDPGIGFGKTLEQNLALLKATRRFSTLGNGVLIGASRKSWIGKLCGSNVQQRLGGSLSAALYCVQEGAAIVRVHDVSETVQALRVREALA